MKIIRGEGGLGSQMFQIVLYERLNKIDPEIYFDLSGYDVFNQHNGWEVENIFNLNLKKVKHNKILKKGKLNFFKRKFIRIVRIFNKNYMRSENYFKEWTSKETKEKYLDYFKKNINVNIKLDKVFMCSGSQIDYESISYIKNAYYVGTYFSIDLFDGIEDKIKSMFKFPEFLNKKNIELVDNYKNRETVSLHIRRGDYLGNPILGGLGNINYYKEAMQLIRKKVDNPVFIIFSNDVTWCKENFLIPEEHIYVNWNKGENSFRDMQLMSLLKNNIITNSSFSWWGAWLNKNPNKIVITPERWFNEKSGISDKKINDKSWIQIKNY